MILELSNVAFQVFPPVNYYLPFKQALYRVLKWEITLAVLPLPALSFQFFKFIFEIGHFLSFKSLGKNLMIGSLDLEL